MAHHQTPAVADNLHVRVLLGILLCTGAITWVVMVRIGLNRWPILGALALVPSMIFTVSEARWHGFETSLHHATSSVLQDRDAEFGCERLTRNFLASKGLAGHVMFDAAGNPAKDAFLSSTTCERIKNYAADPEAATIDQVTAVHILTHEAAHLAGIRNEADAECLAIQHDALVMQKLGAAPATAIQHATWYRHSVHPRVPQNYRSAECVADGALDRTPGDGVWP